jgi:hypothetical protein
MWMNRPAVNWSRLILYFSGLVSNRAKSRSLKSFKLKTPPTGYQALPGNPMSFRLCLIFRALYQCRDDITSEAEPRRQFIPRQSLGTSYSHGGVQGEVSKKTIIPDIYCLAMPSQSLRARHAKIKLCQSASRLGLKFRTHPSSFGRAPSPRRTPPSKTRNHHPVPSGTHPSN